MMFRKERGIAYCGLACVLCREKDCPGCFTVIANGGGCSAGKCAAAKNTDGCYACTDFDSCVEKMPHSKRNQAFNRYVKEFGREALIERLCVNDENGITYHAPDGLTGDYDNCETEDEIIALLKNGKAQLRGETGTSK